jgi:hypothetical protein
MSFAERATRTSRMLSVKDHSFVGFMIFQTARPWIPRAGIARRLGVFPRVIRRLVACASLTVRRIPGFQTRVITDDVDRLAAQHARLASARD